MCLRERENGIDCCDSVEWGDICSSCCTYIHMKILVAVAV